MENQDITVMFGKKVRTLRRKMGYSQGEFSEICGLHRNYISDTERGTRNVSLKAIEKFAKALEIPIKDLLDFSSDH